HMTPGEDNFPTAPHLDVPGSFNTQNANVQLDYSADVSGSLTPSNGSVILTNRDTNSPASSANYSFSQGAGFLENMALSNNLADGNYRLSIGHAGITDDFGLQ